MSHRPGYAPRVDPSNPPKRVAVVAVQGIADQKPGESASAVAGLLARVHEAGVASYGAFAERTVQVHVRPWRDLVQDPTAPAELEFPKV